MGTAGIDWYINNRAPVIRFQSFKGSLFVLFFSIVTLFVFWHFNMSILRPISNQQLYSSRRDWTTITNQFARNLGSGEFLYLQQPALRGILITMLYWSTICTYNWTLDCYARFRQPGWWLFFCALSPFCTCTQEKLYLRVNCQKSDAWDTARLHGRWILVPQNIKLHSQTCVYSRRWNY